VATALQMISWGVQVNEYGNAALDDTGAFVRAAGAGAGDDLWAQMTAYAAERGWSAGDYKKLNLPFESKLWAQSREIRGRMVEAVEEFIYGLLTEVFNAAGTASLAVDAILDAGSYDLGLKAESTEDPSEWTRERALERAETLYKEESPEGDFDD
jgi:fructose-bisphosphate aldolase class II